jgi:hypothetical protein
MQSIIAHTKKELCLTGKVPSCLFGATLKKLLTHLGCSGSDILQVFGLVEQMRFEIFFML